MRLPKLLPYLLPVLLFCYGPIQGQSNLIKAEKQKLASAKDSINYINSINRLGMLYHMRNVDSALYYGIRAKEIATRLQYAKGTADADNVIASVLYIRGMYQESLQLYTHALAAYRVQQDSANVSQVMMNMGNVYLSLGDSTKGLNLFRQVIRTGRKDSIMSLVNANYCMSNPRLSDDSSQYYIDKTREIASRYNDHRVLIAVNELESDFLFKKGRNKESLKVLVAALAEARKYEIDDQEIYILNSFARYYKNQPDSALNYAWRGYQLAKEKGYVLDLIPMLQDILTHTELLGNKDKIISVQKLLEATMAEENENLKKFVGDYIKYNTIQGDNAVLSIVNKNSRTKIWLLVSICVVSLFLLLFIYRLYQVSRKHELELEKLNLQILEQNKTLQVADEFKNKLFSILAHDFRTPLISTISIAGLMKDNPEFTKEEMEHFYGDIEKRASDMLESFDIILQWIKQQLSGYQYKAETLVLHDLFSESADIVMQQISAKKITLLNQIPMHATAVSDKEMLQFVNRNLLSNAIKFSPDGGTIIISCTQDDHLITVSVTDEGQGMDEQTLGKLFSVSSNFGSSTQHGAGIALSMCKDFIQKLGGQIWAQNVEPNGAIFSYSIPSKEEELTKKQLSRNP
ncbi:tetratricopeptide repeat-containing sensor histidine kinase [Pedobacter foliorum]|uniref:tetratricopeptide repeat-containing sensor histidine kinase n=1 Tax=Pedobacter foliorum TaxID=2739058 RepID=UPI0015667973|nr:tetratricopeptide repeat-containing sensor histidine kinase [Pedobacter foliorum]NRF40388.1 tetratricopeptide repeat-containing sensor histidine kinase [Pedobacter foliorum]